MKANTARPRRAAEQPLARFLGVEPGAFGIVLSLVFVVAVGVVDHMTGTGVSLAPFYVMPVVLATRSGGRAWGLGVAGLAAVATRLADPLDVSVLVNTWNALVWFVVFGAIVWLVDALDTTVRSQGRQLARETERVDDLTQQNAVQNTLLHAVSHDLKGP